jgi:hypothetical protein
MSKDTYTPQHNGISGLEEYGDGPGEHGAMSRYIRPVGTVFHKGRPIIGRTNTPGTVAEYFAKSKIELVVRTHTAFSYADPRAWRAEYVRGFKNQCPTRWADGALRFSPGWDSSKAARVTPDQLSSDGNTSGGFAGRSARPGWYSDREAGRPNG